MTPGAQQASPFRGIYPILYAFFNADGGLDRGAMRHQCQRCLAAGAHGLAALGLATEVGKLTPRERRQILDWVCEDVAGRVPVAITVFGSTVDEQAEFVRAAGGGGADWVILQPPRDRSEPEAFYLDFFAAVAARTALPVAVQNAPGYLGVGISNKGLLELNRRRPNFRLLKGEGPAVEIQRTIDETQGLLSVFNGRGGMELPDNLRAGCAGMIPAPDCADTQIRIFELMQTGRAEDEAEAERLYAEILPAIVFVMQSIDSLLCYGKRIAAGRMGLTVHDRQPALRPTPFGLASAARFAAQLGPLP